MVISILLWGSYFIYRMWFRFDVLEAGITLLLGLNAWYYTRRWKRLMQQKVQAEETLRGREERLRHAEAQVRALYQSECEQRYLAQMLGEVSSALTSTLNFEQILDRLLEQIERIVPYDTASVLLVHGDHAVVARTRGFERIDASLPGRLESRSIPIVPDMALHRLYVSGKPLVVADVTLDPTWQYLEESRHVRCWAGAPVIAQNHVIAFLCLDRSVPDSYTQRDADLLAAFSGHAALAMQNALFFEAAQTRANEAEILRQASIALLDAQTIDDTLKIVLSFVGKVVPYDNASIFLLQEEGLLLAATSGQLTSQEYVGQIFPKDDPLFVEIGRLRKPLVLEDAQLDPRFQGWGDTFQVHGWIGAPFVYHDQLIGYLTIDSLKVGAYSQADANIAQLFANEAAIAIQNALLFEQVRQMAITDPLTGLFDRQYFFEVAEREFQRSQRYGSNISLLILDLDYFKQVNDTYGHLIGDEALRCLAKECLTGLREVDTVARYGGEEFVILMPETPLHRALQVAERVLANIVRQPFRINDLEITLSASIGLASRDEQCFDLETLISRADRALYIAKNSGRGRIVAWSLAEEHNGNLMEAEK